MNNKILLMVALLLTASWMRAGIVTAPEKGVDYSFNLVDGSIVPNETDGKVDINYGIFRLYASPTNQYKNNTHGVQLAQSHFIEIDVAGDAIVKLGGCVYSKGQITVSDKNGSWTETHDAIAANCYEKDGTTIDYNYSGGATTLKISFSATTYVPNVAVKAVISEESNGLIDAWDFGATQLDATKYNSQLTEEIINGWYDASIEPGSIGKNFVSSFTAGILSWTGGSNDRLRTVNTNLTRYDNKGPVTIEGETLNGCLYINGAAQTGRYLSLNLNEDDEVYLYCNSQNSKGTINFQFSAPDKQTDVANASSAGSLLKFVAKAKGVYKIFDTEDKPSYYRVLRRPATYSTVSGQIQSGATLPQGYGVQFRNEAGKAWDATVANGSYEAKLPVGYNYEILLSDANGYIINNGTSLSVDQNTTQHSIQVSKITLCTLSGVVNGLDNVIDKLKLVFTPETEKVFVPEPKINVANKTYSVELEPDCEYTISAEDVNDYLITNDKVTVSANKTLDIAFEAKPTYAITITPEGLTDDQKNELSVVFTNLNEEGYTYKYNSLSDIKLRDGVYSISVSGLDKLPLQQTLTSNLKVDGQAASKAIAFKAITSWSFNDQTIANGATVYEGLTFTGSVKNEMAKAHLVVSPNATVTIPANKGDKVTITYYYAANFTINGGETITTNTSTGSTSKTESVEYTSETGSPVVLAFGGTASSYIKNIKISKVIPFSETIYVGKDKEYKTINAALEAISGMPRANSERVKVMIEPGNYEEMLIISSPNISLINAAAQPSIALKNKGVDIDDNAVRVTSYYGHGYNYYSMGNDQKWNGELLRVNKENGYKSYTNTGSGTNNGSYWNATVVISANGFEAENIIFENSYNQYISKKESEDIVEEWVVGGKGTRPTDFGNMSVQNKNFVERAAAIAIAGGDRIILNNCRVVGRQDSFYGANSRVAIYKGVMMGGTDFLFGGMTAVFYKTQLAMNTSEDKNDVSYITAAQQTSGRGYLMYECTVTSAQPETETASAYLSKPGYFGRPWQANTSEVVFYKTTVKTSNHPDYAGKSLIVAEGWNNTLSGTSPLCYEYATNEEAIDAVPNRVSWATLLTEPKLTDGTDITCLNFTKGSDNWDPIPALIEQEATTVNPSDLKENGLSIVSDGSRIYVNGIQSETTISVYGMDGALVKSCHISENIDFQLGSGFWIVKASNIDGAKSAKVVIK